jgi:hypothetical protein
MVQVTDANGERDQRNFTLQVAQPTIVIGDTTVPESEIGVEFTFQLTASGGSSPYLWRILAGSLPPGLALNANSGLISGKPTQSGIFSFTVELVDAQGAGVSKSLTITVAAGPLRLLTTLVESVARDLPYSEVLAAAGGTQPYTWSIAEGVLPQGLILDSATGVISGIANQNGWFPFTLKLTDQAFNTVTRALDITVADLAAFPHIDSATYKKGARKLILNGTNFDKKGLVLIDGIAVSGKIKPQIVKTKGLDLAPGTHAIRIVTSGRLVSKIIFVTVSP